MREQGHRRGGGVVSFLLRIAIAIHAGCMQCQRQGINSEKMNGMDTQTDKKMKDREQPMAPTPFFVMASLNDSRITFGNAKYGSSSCEF